MLKVYGIKNCNSVKKGCEFLTKHNIEYEFVDFKKTAPSLEVLKLWQAQAGVQKIINKAGQTYKKLGLKDQNLNDLELLEIASKNPSLIKRPVLEFDNGDVHFGFDETFYKEKFI